MTTRREFLKSSALLTAASAAGIMGAPKFSFGQSSNGKTFVKVFMRGGADGLHLMPAVGDDKYYEYRPNIAIQRPSNNADSAINLGDDMRALNPNLEPLMEIWEANRLMLSPATAIDEGNRSHFDCQRWIGTGAQNNYIDGYLNRYLQENSSSNHPLRGVVAGKNSISTELTGSIAIPAVKTSGSFNLESNDFCSGSGCADNQLTDLMREIASHEVDQPGIEGSVRENQIVMLDSIAEVQMASDNYQTNAGGLEYSGSPLGNGLKLIAQLLKAGIPLEVAALDWNIGWDTHGGQIGNGNTPITDQNYSYNRNMRNGALDFLTFYRDMGAQISDVVVLVCTEFGRTVMENGSRGTDHGHSGTWFSFGGPSTSLVAPDVPTIDLDILGERNKLPTVVNYRDLVGEIMVRHLGMSDGLVSTVFPNHSFKNENLYSSTS